MEEQSYPQAINLIGFIEFSEWKQTTDLIQATHLETHARAHTHTHIKPQPLSTCDSLENTERHPDGSGHLKIHSDL